MDSFVASLPHRRFRPRACKICKEKRHPCHIELHPADQRLESGCSQGLFSQGLFSQLIRGRGSQATALHADCTRAVPRTLPRCDGLE
eukprot:COSAG02_NODE_13709_length_1358_cov_2.542494_3_plen_86_part_01